MLNEDSDATEVIGIAKISLAIWVRMGYVELCDFQKFSTSKSGSRAERGEFKYSATADSASFS